MFIFLTVVCILSTAVATLAVYKFKGSERAALAAFIAGALLVLIGLLSSLYMFAGQGIAGLKPEQIAFLTSFFLIVASVGANFIASSATATTQACQCNGQNPSGGSPEASERVPASEQHPASDGPSSQSNE